MTAANNRPEEIDPSGARKLLRLLDALRDSPAGNVIYRQVETMLEEIATRNLRTEMAYAGFVSQLLESFLSRLETGSPQYVQLRLLQARLKSPPSLRSWGCLCLRFRRLPVRLCRNRLITQGKIIEGNKTSLQLPF